MGKKRRKRRNGLVHLDPDKLQRQMLRRGLTRTGLADAAGVSRNSILRPLRGEGIFASTAALIAMEVGIMLGAFISGWVYSNDIARLPLSFMLGAISTFFSFLYITIIYKTPFAA